MSTRIGMVAGEPSGDLLAARILQGLHHQDQNVLCAGIGGPHMQTQGFEAWHPMAALTVFGYVDALKRLPKLIRTYSDVKRRWLRDRPGVFVGIDAPDFNLRLETQLRSAGIPTVHFVSPSIWAWRYERIHAIRKAVSHMLVLFPFEESIYQNEGVPVTYVGHPLAHEIPLVPDRDAARARLGLSADVRVLAVMPGSRSSEIRLLAPRFLAAAEQLQQQDPDLHVLVPMVNTQRQSEFNAFLQASRLKNCRVIMADSTSEHNAPSTRQRPPAWDVMEAADAVLVASGTATLEAALFKRPMVISYVLSPTMRRIMAWQSGQQAPRVPWVGLPNILAQEFIVPELLQDDATPDKLADAVWTGLTDVDYRQRLEQRYTELHQSLRRDTAMLAAQAILDYT